MVLTIKLKEVMSAGHAKVQLIHTHAWFHNNKGCLHSFGIIDRSVPLGVCHEAAWSYGYL